MNSVLYINSAASDPFDPDLSCFDDDSVKNDLLNICVGIPNLLLFLSLL